MNRKQWIVMFLVIVFNLCLFSVAAFSAEGIIESHDGLISFTPVSHTRDGETLDYTNAEPIMPFAGIRPGQTPAWTSVTSKYGEPGVIPGSQGSGKTKHSILPIKDTLGSQDADVIPTEYGTSEHPYTTSRVDTVLGMSTRTYPFRATGKLYFKDGGYTYVCSASLIQKGVVVTAAHCVAEFGKERFFSDWEFVPALSGKKAPYGRWTVDFVSIKSSYYYGTDSCAQAGVVCENDVAVLIMAPQNDEYPGELTGWYGYGYNGYSFTNSNTALIQQLGYPVSHDNGLLMQRTDSQGFMDNSLSSNTVWGSRQTGGSSGGPELVNLGVESQLNGATYGADVDFNVVVGVTSWGYTSTEVQQQGASPFTSNNIVSLVNSACSHTPSACDE